MALRRLCKLRASLRGCAQFSKMATVAEVDWDEALGIEKQEMPPSSWYESHNTSRYFLEKSRVFNKNWLCVGAVQQLQKPGSYLCGTVADEPYFILRNNEGELRAFYNVCAHHAAELLPVGFGRLEKGEDIVCPYHNWRYNQDGRLKAAARIKGIKDFKAKNYGLKSLQIQTVGPLIFIHFDSKNKTEIVPRNLESDLSPAVSSIQNLGDDWTKLNFIKREEYEIDCNWKVCAENYLDGGYHLPFVHPALTSGVDMETYRTDIFERLSIQSVGAKVSDDNRVSGGAIYAFVYPNLCINRYGHWMDVNYYLPLGQNRSKVVFDYFVSDELMSAKHKQTLDEHLVASDQVQQEDNGICESVQRGVTSTAYKERRGRYAPSVEQAMYHFHQLLSRDCVENASK